MIADEGRACMAQAGDGFLFETNPAVSIPAYTDHRPKSYLVEFGLTPVAR